MIVRRLMYRWLLPAAVVLPALLFLGWLVFSRDGWALLPTLLIFSPAVFLGQIVLALLVRSRTTVRERRAVSWQDVATIGAWHVLTLLVGWFSSPVFGLTLALAIIAGLGALWSAAWQLWTEGRRSWAAFSDTRPRVPGSTSAAGAGSASPTIVVQEAARPPFGSD